MPRKGKNYTNSLKGPKGECELCQREKPLTEHHLIPRAVHGKKFFRKLFTREEMTLRRINICRMCHKGIHQIIPDEKELARNFNTKKSLLADERIARHVNWAAKQRQF
jgi:hypothetical protein